MKKLSLLVVLLIALCATNTWAEGIHVVKKGECLSVIGNMYKVSWPAIQKANGLKSTIIFPGQQLLIPEPILGSGVVAKKVATTANTKVGRIWKNVGGDPYKGSPEWAINNFALPYEIKAQALKNIREEKFQWMKIGSGQNLLAVTFGRNKIWTDVETRWDSSIDYAAKDYGIGQYHVVYVPWCGNWAWWKETSLLAPPVPVTPPLLSEKPAEVPPVAPPAPPTPTPFTGVAAPKKIPPMDTWDWYVGGGNYANAHQGDKNGGWNTWTKFRYRPFRIEPSEALSIGVGAFGFLAGGKGKADQYYDYQWKEAVLGLTSKILAEHKDFDLDLGIGRLWNDGKWKGGVVTEQVDDIFLASIHGNFYSRRDQGEKWFPKTEANLEYRHPLHTDVERGEEFNNRFVEAMLTQWLYDFDVNGDKSLVVAPGFNLGGGYEWGPDDHGFLKLGPAVEISSYDNVVAGISFMNYKFQSGGQWHPIGGYISIDGAYLAWKASQIRAATESEIRNLPEDGSSKLIRNPADFLK